MTKWASAWSAQFAKERGEKMMMKKAFELTVIAASLFAALFVGCSNMGADAGAAANSNGATAGGQNGAQGQAVVTVSGSLGFSGAMPAQIAALVYNSLGDSGDAASRSAFPKTPNASSLAITVYAEEVTDSDTKLRYDGTVAADNQSYTVGIPVTSGKKYYVHAVAKDGDVEVLFGKSALLDFTTDAEQFYTSRDIALGALQTGKGGVNLTVNVEGAGVERARMGYKPKGSDTITWVSSSKNTAGTERYFSVGVEGGVVDPISAIASGNYTMTFEFYSGAETPENLVYSFTESVSVFDGLVTEDWVKNGSEPWLTPSDTGIACKITAAMIDGFKLTEIYVNPNATSTTESGTFLNPKKSFDDALAMLQNANADYTIYIMGRIGSVSIPDSVIAKSLTLCGAGDPEDGVPTDIIDADGAAGTSALTIATTVPVTIKNLKITGGKGTQQYTPGSGFLPATTYARGGGIFLSAEGGSLTLGKGAYVWKNSADASSGSGTKLSYGGGIFINAPGELNLLDGSVVSDNGAELAGGGIAMYTISSTTSSSKLNIYDGAVIEKNHADGDRGYGGGIFLGVAVEVMMSGGRISGNTAFTSGGAIYGGETLGGTGTFTMTGGVIGDDSDSIAQAAKYGDSARTSDKSNKAGGNGGAFYFANASGSWDTFAINLYGGTVAYNCSYESGGAFYLKSGNLTVKGAEIKYNGATANSGDGGGAILLDERSKLHLDGCTIAGNECYGSAMGGAICIIGNSDTTRTPKTFLKGAVSIPSDAAKKNDICLESYGNTTEWLKDPLLYIEGKLTGSEPVARITIAPDDEAYYTAYRSNRQVLKLAEGVTDVNFPLECYKFAVTPQASATPAQEWAVGGDGYLTKVTTLTGTSIDGFTVADFNEGDKVVYAFDSSVTNDQIDAFTRKLYNKTENQNLSGKKVGEGSVLDFSKATNLTSLGFSWSNNGVFQPFDIILPPNFDTTKFTNQTFAWAIRNAKNVIATPKASGGLVSEDGVVYNKNKTTIFFYPGGKTATSFVVPDGVTTIPRNSFSCNSNLKNITLPEGVTSIAWYACWGTSIESINVPSTVKTIANQAFSNSVTSLTFANPNGWKLGPVEADATPVDSSSLSDPAAAATWYKENAYNVTGATNSNGYKVLWHD